ncbi:MAG: hypothetical protein COC16_02005 [Lutibacter sp.]|nr:MAG: hypothetical protein COC16_02005 [Lutibacter sp.]
MKEYEELKKELKEIAQILKEYPESLQSDVFNLMSKAYMGNLDFSEPQKISIKEGEVVKEKNSPSKQKTTPVQKTNTKATKKRTSSSKDSYKIVKPLNLKGDSNNPSLQKFCEDKITTSSIKFNVIAAYYLKRILNIENVSPDHIYSCYKEMSIKLPTRLLQSLRDTAGSKYGYLDTSDTNDIKVPVTGENFVEHDLVQKPKK